MAATMSNVWAKPGAWALDSEENEAELQQQHNEEIAKKNGGGADLSDFPSLSAAAVTKTKKKKGQTLSLGDFNNYKSAAKPVQKGPTFEDLASLPTGPRERTAEELDRSRLGGGFRSYGGGYDRNRNSDGDDSSNSRWGSSRVSDETRRQGGGFGRESNRDFAPSRADETEDWGATKKTMPNNSFERRDRGGFFGSDSKADESDSWVSNKSFVPSEGRRYEGNRERRVGFESNGGAESDNWMKKKEEEGRRFNSGGGGGGAFDSIRERRGGYESGGIADSETWGRKREEGTGSVSVRPKLNLQPRTLPVTKNDNNQQDVLAAPSKPKGSNPFGDARPREEVLKEKGQDWKEMEEKLESLKVKETGRRNFGNGNSTEARTERGWRKTGHGDATPTSVDETVNENAEAAGIEDGAGNAED